MGKNVFEKGLDKVRKGCEDLGRDIQKSAENTGNAIAENVTNIAVEAGDALKKAGVEVIDALPAADVLHLPSPEDVNRVLGEIKGGVNSAVDATVDGVFDATKEVALAFVPDANLNGLDKAQNEAKNALHEVVNNVVDFAGDEVKRGLEAAQTTIDAYALAKEHKWEEAGKKFAEGIADVAAAAVPPHIRKALELAKGKTGAVLNLTKEALGYVAIGLKEVLKHDPIVQLIGAVDKKAGEELDKAINGAVDGAMRAVYDTVEAGATAVEKSAEAVDALEKGDWEAAAKAAAFAAAGAVQVVGTVYGGVLITGAAGMAAGVTGQFASKATAGIVETVVGSLSPGGAEKTVVKQVSQHADEIVEAGSRKVDDVIDEAGAATKSASPNPEANAVAPDASPASVSSVPGSSDEAADVTKSANPNPEANAVAPDASPASVSSVPGSRDEAADVTKSVSLNPEANAVAPDASPASPSGHGEDVADTSNINREIDTSKANNAEEAKLGDEISDKVDDIDGPNASRSDESGLDAQRKADEAERAAPAKDKSAADEGMGVSNAVDTVISVGAIALAVTATGSLGGAAGLGGLGGGAGSGGAGGAGGAGGLGSMNGLSSGATQIAAAQLLATQNAVTMQALSAIAQAAATQAAILKISNDLNDASVSFMKSVGSGVKAAAQ